MLTNHKKVICQKKKYSLQKMLYKGKKRKLKKGDGPNNRQL